jgi:dolichol-phosphate mannosyltransferase
LKIRHGSVSLSYCRVSAPDDAAGPVWVVIPTYDEAETIESLVAAVRAHLPSGGGILIVDDASPDGTGQIADGLAAASSEVHVLHRDAKRGLGPAYRAGFRDVLARGARRIVQMDADFSHDPADIPRLVDATRPADLAIGSRYVEGGEILDWGPRRKAISRWGSAYARMVLGLTVRDLTSGFKCWRRTALEGIDLDTIGSEGYAFQVEMTYRAVRAGFDVVEVPITFRDRRVGESKMTGSIVTEAALKVPALRLKRR